MVMVLFLFPWEPANVVQVADIPMVVVVVALGGSIGTSGSSVGRGKTTGLIRLPCLSLTLQLVRTISQYPRGSRGLMGKKRRTHICYAHIATVFAANPVCKFKKNDLVLSIGTQKEKKQSNTIGMVQLTPTLTDATTLIHGLHSKGQGKESSAGRRRKAGFTTGHKVKALFQKQGKYFKSPSAFSFSFS